MDKGLLFSYGCGGVWTTGEHHMPDRSHMPSGCRPKEEGENRIKR